MLYTYIQENEDAVKTTIDKKGINLIDYQEFSCQNDVIIDGVKMTVEEFREIKNQHLTKKEVL